MDNLKEKYDEFYSQKKERSSLQDIRVKGWPRNRFEAIKFSGGSGKSLLDIGCGDGILLYQFRNQFSKLIGLEYSPERLRQTSDNLQNYNFEGYEGSAEDMHYIKTESIDQVISADTIEHISDVYRATDEMYRVLKPGGRLVINTPNIAFLKKRILLLFGRFPSTSQANEGLGKDCLFDGGHFHYFTYRSLRLLLEKSGFKVASKLGYGKFGRPHSVLPNMFSAGVQWIVTK